jgi:hypothetical protein
MANRTFLVQADSGNPVVHEAAPRAALAAGSNCIPPFWFSLFDSSSIASNAVILDDAKRETYLYLVTSTEEARSRSSRARDILTRLASKDRVGVVENWLQFIRDVDRPFIHLDAAELWMMTEPDWFESYVRNGLRIFESQQVHTPGGDEGIWTELLDVAQIDLNDLAGTATAEKLAGYSWGGRRTNW